MNPRHFQARDLLWAGPAYAVLLVVAAAAFPAPPGGDIAPATRPDWLAAHAGAVIAQGYVRALAALAFALVGVGVWHLGSRAAAAGSLATGTLMLTAQALGLAAAQSPGTAGVRLLGLAQEALLDVASVPAVVLFAATGLLVLREGIGPRWFGWVSLLGVPLGLADAASYDGGPLSALGLPGLAYFLLWSLLAGVLLHRSARSTR